MNGPRRQGFDWRGWLIPGAALTVAAALLVYTIASSWVTPAPTSGPSPTASDEHEVATGDGVIWFGLVGSDMVVRRIVAGSTTELGRVPIASIASTGPGATPYAEGTAIFAMVCPSTGGDERFVFGHLDTSGPIEYSGPEAVGHGASDGLFLFALLPDTPAGPIALSLSGEKRSRAGTSADVFDFATTDGRKQASGCFVME